MVQRWRCVICGYIHEGQTPPHTCPVCGAPASMFEPVAQDPGGPDKGRV